MKSINFALYQLDSIEVKWKDTVNHLKEAYRARYDIYNESNTSTINELKINYEFSNKEAEAKVEQEKKNLRQRLIRYGIVGILAPTLLFLLTVYRERNKIAKARKRSDELLLNILQQEVAEE